MPQLGDNFRTARLWDVRVWEYLVLLLAAGLVVFVAPMPKLGVIALIFGAAVAKTALVVRNYMHLKREHLLLYAIALIPVLLFVGLTLTLLPDIALRQ
jgi:cytochrome c oxidase subunit IV